METMNVFKFILQIVIILCMGVTITNAFYSIYMIHENVKRILEILEKDNDDITL